MAQQQPVMHSANSQAMPNYPPQQQWNQQNMYPPAQAGPMSPPDGNMPNQYLYQQQPNIAPPKQFQPMNQVNGNSNVPSFNQNNNTNGDLNNQMSNLSLDGDSTKGVPINQGQYQSMPANQFNQAPNSFSNISNQNLPNTGSQTSIPPPPVQQTYPPSQPLPPPPSSQTQQQQQQQPLSPQLHSSNSYGTQNQVAGQNANYNQQPQSNQPETWNQQSQAYPGLNQNQQFPPTNYNNFDQQQNGAMHGYQQQQQQPPAPPTNFSPYQQQQQPPPPMGSNFGSTQPQMNRYPSSTPGPSNFGGQFQGGNQQNRLDPEGMPSVVQVILEDKTKFESNNNVLFTTAVPVSVPPLVTTVMENDIQVVEDGGCARPNFLRPTIYQVPVTEDSLKTSDIPLGLVIKPFDDQEVEGKIVWTTLQFCYSYVN